MIFSISKEVFIIFFLYYIFSNNITRQNIHFYLHYCFIQLISLIKNSNSQFVIHFFTNSEEGYDENKQCETKDNKLEDMKPEPKYEDKYLDQIRKMDKEYIFTEEEKQLEEVKYNEFVRIVKDGYLKTIEEIKMKKNDIERKICKYEGLTDYDYCMDEDEDDKYLGETVKEKVNGLELEVSFLNSEIDKTQKILESVENNEEENEIILAEREKAIQFVIDMRLDKLKDNYIIEKTPHGNVLMFWNNKRGSFEYYSDNTIPYRYLEPVGRKYVKTFNCRQIFIDMEEELKISEEKLKKEHEELENKKLEEQNNESKQQNTGGVNTKKNVFAKFKSYNKEAGTGRVNTAAPPKNSIPTNPVKDPSIKENILLKDNANRYTYEGKFSNFNFLKKVERKIVDKKYAMSFADFKKNILLKK